MIKASELRIGNWVSVFFEGKETNKIAVNAAIIQRIEIIKASAISYEPIPLTPELLEGCSFEKELSSDNEERTIYSIQVANNTSLYFDPHNNWMRGNEYVEWYLSHEWNNNHFKNDFWNNPKYLHQLQNLFFSLTGEELTINLPHTLAQSETKRI